MQRDLEGEALVLRLNAWDSAGRDVMVAYGVRLVPAFLVFDGGGALLFRQGGSLPDVKAIRARVRGAG